MYSKYVKRIMDLILSLIITIVISPILLVVGIAILIDSGRPIIYKQTRVGKAGTKFTIYKFRTMVNGADKQGTSTKKNDARITKVGAFLRKTSLDELPQLFNVIKGEMSLVGFRPDVPRDSDNYSLKKWEVKPGITGYAQVNGRSNLTIEKSAYWEEKYATDIGIWTDIKILLKTVKVVFSGSGSN